MVIRALEELSIKEYYIQNAKSMVSVQKKLFTISYWGLSENLIDTFYFFVDPEKEERIFGSLRKKITLDQEGRGSLFSEYAAVIEDPESHDYDDLEFDKIDTGIKLAGIYCIIQRGRGHLLAQAAIDSGSPVPYIYYGIGGGIRDRMGLVRITIPSEKEMINFVVAEHDVNGIINLLIDAGNLDRPGMGFIFSYPVLRSLADTRTHMDKRMASASIGQIINAIDNIKGNTDWRKRTIAPVSAPDRNFLKDLSNITLICNDTRSKPILDIAMDAGAPGATISKCRNIAYSEAKKNIVKKTVEMSNIIIHSSKKKAIIESLIRAGFFNEEFDGKILIKKSNNAYSYSMDQQ